MKKILFLLSILTMSHSCMSVEKCNLEIYYLPINLEFYIPPTPEFIRENGKRLLIKDLKLTCNLIREIESKKINPAFKSDLKGLRVQITNLVSNTTIYLNKEKNVTYNGDVYEVGQVSFDAVVNEISKSLKVQEINGLGK